MLAIEIRLLTGRYHATPWGRHVNEGDVEWPPSPWRLLRAFLATGFAQLGWTEVPTTARSLVAALAERAPVLALPSGTTAHTRHFMPPFRGNRDKIIDAFVDTGRDAVLGIEWDVELGAAERNLLEALLARLSYLGRAECWVQARCVERLPQHLGRCVSESTAPGPGFERVPLLAPMSAEAYGAWRGERFDIELEREFERKKAAALTKGKKPPAKLGTKDVERVSAAYPLTIVDALLMDTAALQRERWSQPPGSQWLSYWRDERLLSPPPRVASSRRAAQLPNTAILALASDTKNGERLPRFTDALLRLELLHKTLVKKSCDSNGGAPSPSLAGKIDGRRLEGHQHATLVPLCLEPRPHGAALGGRDSRAMDHILVHAPMGLDSAAQEALRRVRVVYRSNMRFFVALTALGGTTDVAGLADVVRTSCVWQSSTPFVPPRHLKPRGKNTLLGQVLAELESRRLQPDHIELEVQGGEWVDLATLPADVRPATRWRHFRRSRLDRDRQPPSTRAFGLRLTFARPVSGPIALGYASHFGLGVFRPQQHARN